MRAILVLGVFGVTLVAAPNRAPACAIEIGWYDRPPTFIETPGQANPSGGSDFAILDAVFADAGCTPLWRVQESWRGIVDGVRSGALGLAPWATRTDERERFAYFTRPYLCDPEQLFVRADYAGPPLTTLSELAGSGLKIGIPAGSVFSEEYEAFKAAGALDDVIVDFAAAADLPDAVLDGRIDGMIRSTLTTAYGFAQRRAWGQVVPTGLVFGVGAVRFMLSRASVEPEIFFAIDAAVGAFVASEDYPAVYDGLLDDLRAVRPFSNGVYGCAQRR